MSIAVVVPTIRQECLFKFLEGWASLFRKHKVHVVTITDGDSPTVHESDLSGDMPRAKGEISVEYVMGKDSDLIFNKNDGVRNLGFAYVAKYLPQVDYILTLDDDTLPKDGEDLIQLHLDSLNKRFSLSWISTASEFTRGFPYGVREEAECVVSHGVWEGVMDWDAPTQLVNGNHQLEFFKGSIPKGIYFPFCGMNVMFKRKMLPYMYYAPMGYKVGMDRFADIWLGINLKRVCDDNGWAIATGYATVRHERASNVWKNLQKEARGLELNETYWQGTEDDPYFKLYNSCRKRWQTLIQKYL